MVVQYCSVSIVQYGGTVLQFLLAQTYDYRDELLKYDPDYSPYEAQ
ncbi:hypothetical protein NFI96_005947 [Prochilodus magdalenae]|nr:hypothetical protein NFI96_005947 [Prochilodus magdalenae]